MAALLAGYGRPALAAERPETFLSAILAHDFDGDGGYRVGKAQYRHSSSDVGECGCSTPRELFVATGDPIVVVNEWKLNGPVSSTPSQATITARYHVVALTKGEGDWSNGPKQRRVIALAQPRDEDVVYHLRLVSGHWVLVDPPLPRVGVRSLVRIVRETVSSYSNTVAHLPAKYGKSAGAYREYEWEKDQLRQLENAFGAEPR